MKTKHILIVLAGLLVGLSAKAQQQPLTPEQEEKKLREAIEEMVLRYEESLKLEVWQTFYVDSILTHNYFELTAETKKMAENRIANQELYSIVADKWEDETYKAFQQILTEDQWKKYLKGGAARAKKAREQRAAKREAQK